MASGRRRRRCRPTRSERCNLASAAPALEITACPVCGESKEHQVAGPDDVRREIEDLWAFHMRRLRPGAPPAHLADRIAFSQRPPLRVAQCDACGLVYRNPRERAFELRDIYTDDALDPAVYESLFQNQRVSYRIQATRLTRALGRPGRALEVGSYVGAFLAAAREQGWTCMGLDINEHATRFARERGLSVEIGALDADIAAVPSAAAPEPTGPGDAGAIWNCLEQLADH